MSVSDNFKNNIKHWVDLDNKQKELRKKVLEYGKEKNNIQAGIIDYMSTNKLEDKELIISDGKLKYSYSKTSESFSKSYIEQKLAIFLKNPQVAKDATEFLYSSRTIKKKAVLKRTISKKKK